MERSRSKPALITPSASPPSSRSFFPQPYRIPDKASPSKRPRLASSSGHLQSHLPSASSSSTSLDQIDVHKAREASTLRLFDVWSTLADRYSRPLDEDDIIDITTGDIVKDRGVLRSSRNWDIGCFADNNNDDDDDDEEEEEEEEEEEDIDELDSFANRGGDEELGDVLLDVDGRGVPPVTEMDPEDAKDLKQFLEAERKRREICGSEEETEDSEEGSAEEGLDNARSPDSVNSDNTNPSSLGLGATPRVEKKDNLDPEPDRTPRRQPSVDSESDDELVNWGVDDASMIYRLSNKEDRGEDHDSDIEIIEAPALHPPSPSPPCTKSIPNPKSLTKKPKHPASKATSSRASKPPQSQLQTPPQSQSSFNFSTPSEDLFAPGPPEPSLPSRSSSPATSSHDSSPTKPRQAKSHLRKSDSRSQRAATSHVVRGMLPPPIPRLDLAKMAQERVTPKSSIHKPMPNSRAKEKTSELVPTSDKALDQGPQGEISGSLSCIGDKPSAPRRSRSHVEVVIDQRRLFSTRTPVQGSHVNAQQVSEKQERMSAKKSSKEELVTDLKGKGREIIVEDAQENVSEADDESDDPITILSSSPISVSKGSGRSHSVKAEDHQSSSAFVLPSAKDEERMNVLASPRLRYNGVVASTPSMGTRKRKRVASSSETEAIDLCSTQNSPVAISTVHSKTAAPSEELLVSRRRKDSTGSHSSVSASPGGMCIF